jgi:hypothetical protein
MNIQTLLADKRQTILDRWMTAIAETYPSDAAKFLLSNRNRFANPVGRTVAEEIETLFDAVIGNASPDEVTASLEQINKIRAVQDFTASQAVAFVFFLKTIIREEVGGHCQKPKEVKQLQELESIIDGLALMAFDSYMQCREKLFEVRCSDIRRHATISAGPRGKKST